MVKRLLATTMCFCMLFSMTGCRHKAKDDTIKNESISNTTNQTDVTQPNETTPPTEPISDYVVDDKGEETNIRNNGKLPSDAKNLTEAETYYYIKTVLKAAFELDIETLKIFSSNKNDVAVFEEIAANEKHKEMYLKTIGNVIYLEDSNYVVYKDPFYFYSRWFNNMVGNDKSTIISELSKEDVDAIYDKYYEDAPYIADRIYTHDFQFNIKDGRIYFEMDNILNVIGYKSVKDLFPIKKNSYSSLLFGTNHKPVIDVSFDGSSAPKEILDIITSGDLDSMVEYINRNENYNLNDDNKDTRYDECYQIYYKETELREMVKDWMKDNVQIYGSNYGAVTYIRANIHHKDNWPFNTFTTNEKEIIKDLPIYVDCVTCEIGNEEEWAQYYLIVEQMIYNGAIADFYA